MSQSNSFTFSSSSTFSLSSSSSNNGQHASQYHSTISSSDPRGTTIRTTSQTNGAPAVQETKHFDNQGRELLTAPATSNSDQARIQGGRFEDVSNETDETDADRRYEEAMEDEYAKREGGA